MRMRIIPTLLALLLASCGTAAETTTTTTTVPDTTTTTTPPTETPAETAVIDWDDRDMTVTLDGGWSVTHCEGDGPLLCVSRDGEVVGVLERIIADPHTYSAYDPAADDETNLRAIAADFVAAFQQDRASGCGADYLFEPFEPTVIDFGGNPGLAYGFQGATTVPSEYNLQYSTIAHGRLMFLVAAAYDEAGCPGKDDMISFNSSVLREFQPHLEALLAASPLPGGDPETGLSLPDGHAFAWILAVDGGLVVDPAYVLSGEEARLQATADGPIAAGEDLPNDIYLHNPTEDAFTLRVSDDVKWTVIASVADGLTARQVDQATISSILAGGETGDIYGLTPDFMPFDLLVINGEVVEINQRYLP